MATVRGVFKELIDPPNPTFAPTAAATVDERKFPGAALPEIAVILLVKCRRLFPHSKIKSLSGSPPLLAMKTISITFS